MNCWSELGNEVQPRPELSSKHVSTWPVTGKSPAQVSANLKWIPETPLACELILFVLISGMSCRLPQLVLCDTQHSLHGIFIIKMTMFGGSCGRRHEGLDKSEKDEKQKIPPLVSLPTKHLSFSTAGPVRVSKYRAQYSILV